MSTLSKQTERALELDETLRVIREIVVHKMSLMTDEELSSRLSVELLEQAVSFYKDIMNPPLESRIQNDLRSKVREGFRRYENQGK